MSGQAKNLQQQLQKAQTKINNLSYLAKQSKRKDANHIEKMKELKIKHQKALRKHFQRGRDQATQLGDMLIAELESKLSKTDQELQSLSKFKKLYFEKLEAEENQKKVQQDFELL